MEAVTREELKSVLTEHAREGRRAIEQMFEDHRRLTAAQIATAVESSALFTTEQLSKLWRNGPITRIQADLENLRKEVEARPCIANHSETCRLTDEHRETIEEAGDVMAWMARWPKWMPLALVLIGAGVGSGVVKVGSWIVALAQAFGLI